MSAATRYSYLASKTIDPASVTNATAVDQTFTGFTGLKAGSHIAVEMASLEAGLVISNPRCTTDGSLIVRFANVTGAPINPASQTISVLAF